LGIPYTMIILRPQVYYSEELSLSTIDHNLIILITTFVYTYCRASLGESHGQRILEFSNEMDELYRLGILWAMIVLRPEVHHGEKLSPAINDHNLIILIATFVYMDCRANYCESNNQRFLKFDNEMDELYRLGICIIVLNVESQSFSLKLFSNLKNSINLRSIRKSRPDFESLKAGDSKYSMYYF